MAYSTSLDQKRRETLRRQLYGKEVMKSKASGVKGSGKKDDSHSTFTYKNESGHSSSGTIESASYLRHDLTKILIYSAVAVGAQVALYFAVNLHVIKLPI